MTSKSQISRCSKYFRLSKLAVGWGYGAWCGLHVTPVSGRGCGLVFGMLENTGRSGVSNSHPLFSFVERA